MTTCNRCWPWCRSTPVVQSTISPPPTPESKAIRRSHESHNIPEVKAFAMINSPISAAESVHKYSGEPLGHVRFVSTEVVSLATALRAPPRALPPRDGRTVRTM